MGFKRRGGSYRKRRGGSSRRRKNQYINLSRGGIRL